MASEPARLWEWIPAAATEDGGPIVYLNMTKGEKNGVG